VKDPIKEGRRIQDRFKGFFGRFEVIRWRRRRSRYRERRESQYKN